MAEEKEVKGCYPLYWGFRLSLRIVFKLFWTWERVNPRNMPAEGPVIIASNHASFMDPTVLGAFYERPIGFMARKTLFKVSWFGWLIKKLYAFPVDRGGDPRSALRAMSKKLSNNDCVVMFPEGTRTRTGTLGQIRRGVGMIAVKNNAAVIPTYLGGTFESWPRTAKFLKFCHMRIEAGTPIYPQYTGDDKEKSKAEEARIQAEVERQLHELEHGYYSAVGKQLPLSADDKE
ncbi:MAG: lysophospholipid acyltransferase family protein [Planctomycetota bacterium]|jgi:1-acyl-sn-glycerol-3-phosphate acyltransferase